LPKDAASGAHRYCHRPVEPRAGLNHHLVERLVAIPEGNKLAILWLDLDRFKEINDTLGHQVGDRCLVEVAARLRRSAPVGAGIGRFGGDEFIIAFEAEQDTDVKAIADTILTDILRPLRIDDDRLEIGCSIGIAILPEHGTDLEAVLQGADLALNHAKLNGRKQIVSFNPSMTRDLIRRKEIEAERVWRCNATNCRCIFSRWSIWKPGAFERSKRWSAGSIRKRANCVPTNSSPWPRKAAPSSRWATGSRPRPRGLPPNGPMM
jgi:diguanylate cyclase (GGDEF)-like protein